MNILRLHDVTQDKQVLEYFIWKLSDGTSLAARAATKIDFTKGRFIVALPEDADLAALPGFDHAGYLRFHQRGAPTLAHIVKGFLAGARGTVILQDTEASPGEPWLEKYKYRIHVVEYDGEIYWRISDSKMSEEEITGVILSASFYPFAAFFSLSEELSISVALLDADLDKIVSMLAGLAVGAFDEDSFLLWWSDSIALSMEVKSP